MTKKFSRGLNTIIVLFLATIVFTSGNIRASDHRNQFSFDFGSFSFSFSNSSDEKKILELVNQERRKRRLNDLVWDSKLGNLARSYSSKMANENFFGHKDSKGKSLIDRANDFNITNWTGLGENLYFCKGYDDPTEPALAGWLKSPGHRTNMLKNSWTSTGIGIAKASDGRIYVTQVFMK